MFKIGDRVCYRSEGVCEIIDIRIESFGGNASDEDEKYYILVPENDANSMLYIPVSNPTLTGKMKPLLSVDEIYELAKSLQNERIDWIEAGRIRNTVFKNILADGDRNQLIILINTINERVERTKGGQRSHTAGDEGIMKRAQKMLLDEFSQTSDICDTEKLMELLCSE